MSDLINEYIENISEDWQAEICQNLHKLIVETIPDVEARLQYKKPHYLKNGKYVVVFGTAKKWVNLTIFNADTLSAPSDLYEQSDNGDRLSIKIQADHTPDYDELKSLIKQASDTIG